MSADELCPCGEKATHFDPHLDGDAPVEFCKACYDAECDRLDAIGEGPYE